MKKLLFIPIALAMMSAQKPPHNISGQIKGLKNDTLVISYTPILRPYDGPDQKIRYDTITARNGRFAHNLPATEPMEINIILVQLMEWEQGERRSRGSSEMQLFLDKGEQVRIDGKIDSTTFICKLSGTQLNEDYSRYYAAELPFQIKIDQLQRARKGKSPEEEQLLFNEIGKATRQQQQLAMDYIKANPNNPFAGYCLTRVSLDHKQAYYKQLGEAGRNSIFRPQIEYGLALAERFRMAAIEKEHIVPGIQAPDFTFKTIDNKDFTLSSLRGKYVVLDFWGSWCGWCIKGIPEMKKYYEKYAGKFEIVGIACGDKEANWRKAVADNTIPWINIIDQGVPTDQKLRVKYGIEFYPTKIIIDPDGRIVSIIDGETPEFYTKLDSLLK